MTDCVIQCGRRCVETRGLNRFSRTCLAVGVDPKKFDGILEVFCCEIVCNGRGVLWIVLLERFRGFWDGDEGKRNFYFFWDELFVYLL